MNHHIPAPEGRAGTRPYRGRGAGMWLRGALPVVTVTLLVLLPAGAAVSETPERRPDAVASAAPDSLSPEAVPGRVLVKAGSDSAFRALESVNERLDARTEEAFPALDLKVVEFDAGRPVGEVLAAYRREPAVEYAEPDLLRYPTAIPDDPRFGEQWGLANTGQSVIRSPGTPGADIGAVPAWDTTKGGSTLIALVDTGVAVDHPDLARNVWTNPGEIPGDGRDNDGNGYADDVNGWNFHGGNAAVFDEFGGEEHGTHTAGTLVAAADNGRGISGVAPAARVVPLKACGPEACTSSAIVAAFDYATRNGAKVVNGSFGGGGASQAERDAIERGRERGVLFVFPAGNAGEDLDAAPFYPASYPNENVISVAASDNRDTLADFSGYGTTSVDLAAPGVGILSTAAPAGRSPVAVRVDGAYRSTYAGFGLEQVSGAEARRDLLSKALADLGSGPAAPILLVDDDGGASHETYYRAALAALGYADVTVAAVAPGSDGPAAGEMRGRTVVWLTGSEHSDTLREADLATLTAHLAGGGRLLLMGQDIGYDIGGGRPGAAPTAFYADYLKARLADDDFDPASVSGPPGGVFGESSYRLSGGDSAGYDSYVDRLDYAPGASAALLSDADAATYATMSGTSMAAPHVSGVAALLASRAPGAGYREIRTAILETAEKKPGLEGRTVTGGRLAAAAALDRIATLAPTPTKLTLVSSRRISPYNGSVALTGELTDASGPLANETVTVWRSADGGKSWKRSGTAAYLPASGKYRAVRVLESNAAFRLRFAGSERYGSAVSGPVFVKARAHLSRPESPLVVERGEFFVTRGILKPRHAGTTRLVFERYSPLDGWKVKKRVEVRNEPRSGYSAYSLRHRLSPVGVWRVRAYHADGDHAPTWSPPRRFTVRG